MQKLKVGLFAMNHAAAHVQAIAAVVVAAGHSIHYMNSARFAMEPERAMNIVVIVDAPPGVAEDIDYCHEANGIKVAEIADAETAKAYFLPKGVQEVAPPVSKPDAQAGATAAPEVKATPANVFRQQQKAAAATIKNVTAAKPPARPRNVPKAPAAPAVVSPANDVRPAIQEVPPI